MSDESDAIAGGSPAVACAGDPCACCGAPPGKPCGPPWGHDYCGRWIQAEGSDVACPCVDRMNATVTYEEETRTEKAGRRRR